MKGLKVAIIGAGSTYTPEIIEGFILKKEQLKLENLYLMDIDRYKLEIVGALAKRMLDAGGMNTVVVLCRRFYESFENNSGDDECCEDYGKARTGFMAY